MSIEDVDYNRYINITDRFNNWFIELFKLWINKSGW